MTSRPSLVVRPLARRDIAEAAVWYEERTSGLGFRFVAVVDTALVAVGADPDRYPRVYRDVRRALVDEFPYALYFVIRANAVHVLACTHGRRHPRRWQSRARGV